MLPEPRPSRRFSCTPILLATLAQLGIADSALSWFKTYLTNRTYQVTWMGSLSKPCTFDTGVPQGSILGPVLFSLYTSKQIIKLSNHITRFLPSLLCRRHSATQLFGFRHHDGGASSLPMSGHQSRSPAPAGDSRLTCSEFTWTLHSLSPYPPPPLLPEKHHSYLLILCLVLVLM